VPKKRRDKSTKKPHASIVAHAKAAFAARYGEGVNGLTWSIDPLPTFQIVPGEYVFTSGSSGTTQHAMFRISTETGGAALYTSFVDTNRKLQMFWGEIDETITADRVKH
jgi:hypothetical protein